MPLVSVVIPTRHRPQLVLRAIHSVLNQTYEEIELIVVVDGPDETTVAAIRGVQDSRLQLIVNPRSMTAAGASQHRLGPRCWRLDCAFSMMMTNGCRIN